MGWYAVQLFWLLLVAFLLGLLTGYAWWILGFRERRTVATTAIPRSLTVLEGSEAGSVGVDDGLGTDGEPREEWPRTATVDLTERDDRVDALLVEHADARPDGQADRDLFDQDAIDDRDDQGEIDLVTLEASASQADQAEIDLVTLEATDDHADEAEIDLVALEATEASDDHADEAEIDLVTLETTDDHADEAEIDLVALEASEASDDHAAPVAPRGRSRRRGPSSDGAGSRVATAARVAPARAARGTASTAGARTPVADEQVPVVVEIDEPVVDDELERIEGIGPRIAEALRAGGIRTFARVAATDQDELRAALTAAGLRFTPSLRTWATQAGYLARGDEQGFRDYTDHLVAGREPSSTGGGT
jgi:predicted flap endonuclease-1-like 5' DNA nuclease